MLRPLISASLEEGFVVEACGLATGLPIPQLNHKPLNHKPSDFNMADCRGGRSLRRVLRPIEARAVRCKNCEPSDFVTFREDD